MLQSGYLSLGRIRGIPVRAHPLILLGALFFTGFRFEPAAWLGFVALILTHELGHALVIKRYGLHVESIDLHAFGGATRWAGYATGWQRAVIAWGGVVAQVGLLLLTLGIVAVIGTPRSVLFAELVSVFTVTNLWLIGLNLLPFPPLDGATAWKIVRELRDRWSSLRLSAASRRSEPRPAPRTYRVEPRPRVSPEEAARIARAFEDAIRGSRP